MVEVAHSTRAIDLHWKLREYEQAGVLEYLVLTVEEPKLHWFNFATKSPIEPDRRGISRSPAFPGLWINGPILISGDRTEGLSAMTSGD